jgi:hypothetical protein
LELLLLTPETWIAPAPTADTRHLPPGTADRITG